MEENQTAVTPEVTQTSNDTTQQVVNNVEETPTKTYTSEQVKALMDKRIERSHNSMFNRYKVKSFEELDDICNNYRSQQEEFGKLTSKNAELTREIAFLKNNIDPEKYEDIIAYFKGKEIEFSEEALKQELSNHQEWLKKTPLSTTIRTRIGVSKTGVPTETDEEKQKRIFG